MKRVFSGLLLTLFSLKIMCAGDTYAKWSETELVLDNGIVQRTIKLPSPEGSFITTSYKPVSGDFNYFLKTNPDFQFEVNDVIYSGKGTWKFIDIKTIADSGEGKGAAVTLISQDKKVELTIKFLLYPNSPAIRKCLIVKNLTADLAKLESVDIEKFDVPGYYPVTFSWIYHDYGRRRYIGNYDGGKQDALIIVHDMNTEQGIVLGNEATGVMKHTSVFWEAADICVGMTHKNALFPFRKWIGKGESFETPQVFTMVYNNQKTPDEILNSSVPDFVRKHMGIRLSELKEKPTFVYNTWEPFKKEINEKLVIELAKAAADAGMKEFIIDDGWQDSYGDWGIDYKKFPNGLKPVFEYIKSLGMKPGIWISIGSAAPSSKVYKAHPEWFVTDNEGSHTSLHSPGDKEKYTACFGTGWYGYIKEILLKMAVEYGLEYYKLDFAVVTSAYTFDHKQSGCYSADHQGHKDHNESLFTNYERLWQLFDELHAAKPNLFIDCTFETLGGTQAIDYALLKHAEGDWLSNFAGAAGEKTDIRIRNMAWWRSPAMPATALVIGNPQMQDKGWETHIKSIAGALPIMLGDPRKLSDGDLKKYRSYADWLQLMETRYEIMSFRQDLPGFGEPMEGMWDGFQRINTETKQGGIIGVFRHGSVETKRIITLNWLDLLKTYQVKSIDGKIVASLTGSDLKTKGFPVTLDELYSGELFEICISETSSSLTTDLNIPLKYIGSLNAKDIGLYYKKDSGKVQFAVNEIQKALNEKGIETVNHSISVLDRTRVNEINIVLVSKKDEIAANLIKKAGIKNADELKEEGFIVQIAGKDQKTIYVLGFDEAGTMYGGLEVAEIIKVKGIDAVQNQLQNAYMKVRGTKFNIPLDMRSPTYTEPSDAAQKNMAEMWNFEFWKEYIDNLARYRYNLISLWNMHPFPSMVKVPEYPDISLNDVRRSTGAWKENYSLNGWGFDAPEIMKSYEVIKKMTIDDKIDFWRKVMAYGKQRNVQFYIITWNIFVYGTEGKYGITDKVENPVTTDYFRKSVKQMVLTYPDLAGIGLATGENMYDYTATQKEEWAYATYGQGMMDALKEQPDRKISFIHRQHQSKASEITKIFKGITENKNINFLFSFKYAQAHVYSSVNQVFHQDFVKDIQSEKLKTLWTLRNDDNFYFRWGAPDFVRNFIRNIPYDVSEGFYYGSDQYVWGREFLSKNTTGTRELEIVKHWFQWMCWGRLGYNPDMGNDRFVDIIQSHFPSVNAREMFDAWQSASMIYPLVTGFHWGSLDFQWYIESGQSQPDPAKTPTGYHDINRFITLPPHKGTGFISIPEYTKLYPDGSGMIGETPLEVAEKIIHNADQALKWADKQNLEMNQELRITIDDFKAIAWLGKYYAHKIRGAAYLSLFRESFNKEWHKKVIEELNISAGYWRHYAACGLANYYNPLWTNRVGNVDWKENFSWALYDITANGGQINLTSMQPTPGGTILEAENAEYKVSGLKSDVSGFTGKGYLETSVGDSRHQVKWTYIVPEAGSYILEFRYTLKREQLFISPLEINGTKTGQIEFWNTGNAGSWVWERITVNFEKGETTIAISPEGFVLLDHVNIVKITRK